MEILIGILIGTLGLMVLFLIGWKIGDILFNKYV
ncbi:MAG: hypothetical protein KQ78_01796 [Candidatus Izimaplasma bacterium HR2]|nr:MAG: hypothetical protein KQ78_01796 [Candidatus Izimaplasma bacterium HR2]